ncbi:MAG: hypothetical protein K9K66_16525 [Desulfarculaceae bacterium]|nr:hypothetical protein [Desulfarculaceae bacterium]MCF8074145.1 hypothetical protein [Desulfarculaceae bacterium]MCF8103263.1 hypothetical protein [Desulfarculaceae bacterium]MCF8116879.1 hypothetical protein [Desulfarculaceae bacterium]
MRHLGQALILCAVLILGGPANLWAQSGAPAAEQAEQVLRLEKVIQAQQHQIEAQQKQLDQQRKLLLELQRQVQGLRAPAAKAAPAVAQAPAAAAQAPAPAPQAKAATAQEAARPGPVPANSPETGPHSAKEDSAPWTGSFNLKGLKTRFAIGGFAQLDVIHDTGAITDRTEFTTASIVTRGATKAQGSDGQTTFSVNATQFWFETRTDLERGRLRTYLSLDFFADTSGNSPRPRLREAYGELSHYVFGGTLLAGQAWSTTAYTIAYPNTLDYQGPSSMVGLRQPQVRWTRSLGHGLGLKLAAETPGSHEVDGADPLTAWPDGIAALEWKVGALQVQGTGMLRDLKASRDNGPTESALGWGFNLAGVVDTSFLGPRDNLAFSLVYGQGVGSLINDAPPDAYYNPSDDSLELLPAWGWYLGYEHWWSPQWASVLVYGSLQVDNADGQADNAYHSAQYASANLMWMPVEWWLVGAELLWGERVDKDGADGDDTRLQLTTKFTF